jgi:cellulose synthase (UDP-forming)
MSEVQILATTEITYGMLFFASIPFLMAILSLYAVWESGKLSIESPWEDVNIDRISTFDPSQSKK